MIPLLAPIPCHALSSGLRQTTLPHNACQDRCGVNVLAEWHKHTQGKLVDFGKTAKRAQPINTSRAFNSAVTIVCSPIGSILFNLRNSNQKKKPLTLTPLRKSQRVRPHDVLSYLR
jgi:hypothetical protein